MLSSQKSQYTVTYWLQTCMVEWFLPLWNINLAVWMIFWHCNSLVSFSCRSSKENGRPVSCKRKIIPVFQPQHPREVLCLRSLRHTRTRVHIHTQVSLWKVSKSLKDLWGSVQRQEAGQCADKEILFPHIPSPTPSLFLCAESYSGWFWRMSEDKDSLLG